MTRHKAYTKIPFAALFFAATLISPALHALNIPDYRFHTMPETSYYGGIHSIAKDSVGRMWFSGYDALFMYNGTSFVRMTDLVTNLLPNSYWSYGQVITDNRKGLYVLTKGCCASTTGSWSSNSFWRAISARSRRTTTGRYG